MTSSGPHLDLLGALLLDTKYGAHIAAPRSVVLDNLYNGFGQRVRKSSGAGVRHFFYAEDGITLLGEYGPTGAASTVSETVYIGDTPVLVLRGGSVFYVLPDYLNTPRVVRNSSGTTVWRWHSDAFGVAGPNENPGGVSLFSWNARFPGQYFDSEAGLYYNNARYYDAATGRYYSSDPIGLAGGLNTYAYVGGDPFSLVDIRGLAPELNFFDPNEKLYGWAQATPDINGWFRVVAHGAPTKLIRTVGNRTETIDAKKLAELIRARGWKPGTPVILQSCSTGAVSNGIAQQLADELYAPVSASAAYVWFFKPDNSGAARAPVPSHLGVNVSTAVRLLTSPGYATFFPRDKNE